MSNIYLEKIALNRGMKEALKGALSSVKSTDRAGNVMASSSLNKMLTGETHHGRVITPAFRTRQTEHGIRYGMRAENPAREIASTDILARTNVRERLAAHKARQAALASNAHILNKTEPSSSVVEKVTNIKDRAGHLVNRAKDIATNHPKAAIGGAAAGVGLAGYAAGRSDNDNVY